MLTIAFVLTSFVIASLALVSTWSLMARVSALESEIRRLRKL